MELIDEQLFLITFKTVFNFSMKTIGLVGNILLFVVYIHSRRLRQLSVSAYLQPMAFFCGLQILFDMAKDFNLLNFPIRLGIFYKIFNYVVQTLFPSVTIWLQVVVTLDRLLTILFSIRFPFLKKHFFQRAVVSSVVVYNFFFYLSVFFLTERRNQWNVKELVHSIKLKIKIDLYNSTIVPFVLILTFSVTTFVVMVFSHRRIELLTQDHLRAKKRRRRDIKFGATMLFVNILFLGFMALNRFNLSILNPFDSKSQHVAFFIVKMIIEQLSESFYIFTFYVQLAVNSMVRRECRRLLRRLVCVRLKRIQPVECVSFSRARSFKQLKN